MTYDDIRQACIESGYPFEDSTDVLGKRAMIATRGKCSITVTLDRFRSNMDVGELYVDVTGEDRRDGRSGFGFPCETIGFAMQIVSLYAARYGIEKREPQLTLF